MVQAWNPLLTLEAKEVVRKYFEKQGFREINPPVGIDVAFTCGETTVGIKFVKLSQNPVKDRRLIRNMLYQLLRDKPCDEMYLALEDIIYSHLPAPEEFQMSGIGLLKLNKHLLEVVIRAVSVTSRSLHSKNSLNHSANNNEKENKHVRLVIDDQIIKSIKEDIIQEVYRRVVDEIKKNNNIICNKENINLINEIEVKDINNFKNDIQKLPLSNELLEFLKDNPWLNIIGKRDGV
ncbi:MAG: hypothetical protein RMI04_02370 [Thermofilaceae archaeon]|nr:hypothetical protein [Thermofilaceae archaeon]